MTKDEWKEWAFQKAQNTIYAIDKSTPSAVTLLAEKCEEMEQEIKDIRDRLRQESNVNKIALDIDDYLSSITGANHG